jgi:phosphoribosylanthranilate isomerase
LAKAKKVLDVLPVFVEPIGVFVDLNPERARRHYRSFCSFHLNTIQLHGNHEKAANFLPYRTILAFGPRGHEDLEQIKIVLKHWRKKSNTTPVAVLLDGHAAGLHGGTGRKAPWELLAGFEPGLPVILAGGLTPDNVAEAIRIVRPFAVDVASGVESSPGRKDAGKMRRFVDRARAAAGS